MAGTQGTKIRAVHREEWLDAGACRNEDPELFFPITSSGPSARQIEAAKAVCRRCSVQAQCLLYALESHQNYGVWGGTSEEERSRMTLPDPDGPRATADPMPPAGPRPTADARPAADPRPASRRPASARWPSRRTRSGREGRNVGYRA